MPPALRGKARRKISSSQPKEENVTLKESSSTTSPDGVDLDQFAKDVVEEVIRDNLPPTPNNYSLYFDRRLDTQSDTFKKQTHSILELEESNDAENTIILEQNLKQGFVSVKNILGVTANLYKNMTLMAKILDKRKRELLEASESVGVKAVADALEGDVNKLNAILKKQSTQMKELYEETGTIVKKVEQESIFDNKFGVYNKRYLFAKIEKEMELIKEFNHSSSLIMIELSNELRSTIHNDKVITLMTRTIARLLLKTSRRSDVVAHYGKGIFVMLLKHTDIASAKKASERLCELVANSNFFLADKEIQLQIAVGITEISPENTTEETIVYAMDATAQSYALPQCYAVENRAKEPVEQSK